MKLLDAGGDAYRERLFLELVDRMEASELMNLLKEEPEGLPPVARSALLRIADEGSTGLRGYAGCVSPTSEV